MSDEAMRILYNGICIICCTVLALVFAKWQIMFLVCLFWIYKK